MTDKQFIDSFLGTWRLLSFTHQDVDGSLIDLYGEDPQGYIMYTADGMMSVSIMRNGRANFANESQKTDEEYKQAFSSHFSYCGKYSTDSEKVTHHVQISNYPNWCGDDLVRYYEFAGDKLTLNTAAPADIGKQANVQLIWQRV